MEPIHAMCMLLCCLPVLLKFIEEVGCFATNMKPIVHMLHLCVRFIYMDFL